jgi:hypothetical protein
LELLDFSFVDHFSRVVVQFDDVVSGDYFVGRGLDVKVVLMAVGDSFEDEVPVFKDELVRGAWDIVDLVPDLFFEF